MSRQSEAEVLAAEELLTKRRLDEALDRFQQGEAGGAEPNRCAAGRWMIHMLQGDFESAWSESDAICRRDQPDPHRFWRGESLHNKRVMLRCLHGLGDAVQFLRYVPQLRAVAQSLVVEVNPRFVELARCFEGVDQVITWDEAISTKAALWDVQIEIMELPYCFRTQLRELPLHERYLKLLKQCRTRARNSEALQVGLVWTAGKWNPERSIPYATLRPLLQVKGCEFWNLEGAIATDDSAQTKSIAAVRQEPDCRDSILRLAEIISQLDLVITVDTLAAHLAGALGVPCMVLLQYAADWRWMHGRADSPWYPSLQLFRQQVAGDWSSVITSAHKVLQQRAVAYQPEVCSQ